MELQQHPGDFEGAERVHERRGGQPADLRAKDTCRLRHFTMLGSERYRNAAATLHVPHRARRQTGSPPHLSTVKRHPSVRFPVLQKGIRRRWVQFDVISFFDGEIDPQGYSEFIIVMGYAFCGFKSKIVPFDICQTKMSSKMWLFHLKVCYLRKWIV